MKNLKAELSFNHLLVTTVPVSSSIIIQSTDNRNEARSLKDVQTVVKTGPFIKAENGIDVKPGDRVLLDTVKLNAKNARVINMSFDKNTGEYIELYERSKYKESDLEHYVLITDREILMKL